MYGFLLSILMLDGLALMVVVLLQSGKGGGLAAMGGGAGTDMFMGGRQAATFLTKATWVTGGLFLVLAVALAVLSSKRQGPTSVLQGEFQQQQQTPPAPQPLLPGAAGETGQGTPPPASQPPAQQTQPPPQR
ncbi:MAG TPA: preprotein translocase subunit SecG [Longimicrobiales bacterium]|nr:preprotein translocase subunit SecG [Longimicrobiales bacterium]